MRNIYLSLIILISVCGLESTAEIVNFNDSIEPFAVTVLESENNRTVLNYTINGYTFDEIAIDSKIFTLIQGYPKESMIGEKGFPRLPRINRSLRIPDDGIMSFEIISSNYIEIKNIDIAPSKGHLLRSVDPNTVPYTFAEVYQKDAFFPAEIANIRKPYIMRDYRGAVVEMNAFQYNPVARVLRIYTDITIEVKKTVSGGENTLVRSRSLTRIDPQFKKIYQRRFANFSGLDYPTLCESGEMLIICYDEFIDEMSDFVAWKIQRGIPTELVPASEAGNTPEQIKSYIQDYYHSHDLCYVLFVGDAAQIPTFSRDLDSDPIYSQLVGTDSYPDIFVGRFSAENIAQVATQVQRTIDYERYPDPSGSWYDKGFGIASTEGPFPEHYGEYDYTHMTNIAYKLLDHTYTQVDSAYDPWCTMEMAVDFINDGKSILFYTGHGGPEGWGTSGISTAEVDRFVNSNMLPHVNSVACNTGQFVEYTCLGEAWLRATHESTGLPTGGIGFYGSVEGMTGAPPLDMQDEAIDVLVADSMLTLGGICFSGSMLMMDNYPYPDVGPWEFANLTIFGDPSVSLRGGVPYSPLVSHNPEVPVGTSSFYVSVTSPYGAVKGAMVCGMNQDVYATAVTNASGQATLTFDPPISSPGSLTLTVSGGDMIPYTIDLDIIDPSTAYVIYEDHIIQDDLTGNGNGQLEFYETIELGIVVLNDGASAASNISGTITTDNPLVTVNRDSVWIGAIAAGSTTTVDRAFEFSVNPQIEDLQPVTFLLTTTNGIDIWESSFSVIVHAPDVVFSDLFIDDSVGGNGDSLLAPGENANLIITLGNAGSYTGENIEAVLACENTQVIINSGMVSCGDMPAGSETRITFNVTIEPDFYPPGSFPEFTINISGDHGYTNETGFSTTIGNANSMPTGPDNYGYMAYDRYDYPFFTEYDWIELVPDSGGVGNRIPFTQIDQVHHLALPFDFQYYGITYDSLTVTTPGHICMGVTNEIDYTSSSIPNEDGPPAMVSAIWGDLDPSGATVGGDAGGVWYQYSQTGHYFVIEYNYVPWYALAYDGHTTYEIILYDPEFYPTSTGDGQIKFQFKEFESWGPTGIENHDEDDGLLYRNGNIYPATAATLEDQSAILFSTPITIPEVTIAMTPAVTPVTIPGQGGSFDFNIALTNNEPTSLAFSTWIMVQLPNQNWYGPVLGPVDLSLPAGNTLDRDRSQTVPGSAPAGTYTYEGRVGTYPDFIWDSNSFTFEKLSSGDDNLIGNWSNTGESFDQWLTTNADEVALPLTSALRQNYPNPFNPTTSISFALPETSQITLTVFDVQGREIAELVNGRRTAGIHEVTFDASDLPSGIYFYHMVAKEFTAVKKMALIK
ncbi:hypothetical protein CEE37_05320 [candidate division LCP-89 bacterium B3_LCP]|uniref:Gingipain R n=1 Tax=candidate division LCP-89 bacterium B3_LCP TaxID=2012998 RepID=A0A532V1P2_UNCL8|nr:MAG: hypothetical protein CEE37_05320 [candidate division LCP-89 bacterium B3_LCP]